MAKIIPTLVKQGHRLSKTEVQRQVLEDLPLPTFAELRLAHPIGQRQTGRDQTTISFDQCLPGSRGSSDVLLRGTLRKKSSERDGRALQRFLRRTNRL